MNVIGVIIVIDYHSFHVEKGVSFRKLCLTLETLFKNFNLIEKSLIFIINKTDDHSTNEEMIDYIKSMYSHLRDDWGERLGIKEKGTQLMSLIKQPKKLNKLFQDEKIINSQNKE